LPNSTAHNETCAAIGNVLWNWRMLQITGEAKYAGEFNVPGLIQGYVVGSTIAKGHIGSIDTSEALRVPGRASATREPRPLRQHVPTPQRPVRVRSARVRPMAPAG
jgi:CO/xanthine dehydrogenase Mo-binding subunit